MNLKKRHVYTIIGLLILIIGIFIINAAIIDKTTIGWHSGDNVTVSIDGIDRTLQYAISNDLFIDSHTYALPTSILNPGHGLDEIWISTDSGEMTLLYALSEGIPLQKSSLTTSYSFAPGTLAYHFANEIEISAGKSFQDAIDNGEFSCVPETCISLGYECGIWDDGCGGILDCGTCFWNKTIGGISYDYGRGITTDSSGNVYVTGYTKSFGEGRNDIWTIKYDSNGNQLWNKTLGGELDDYGYGITTDSSGNIYVVGYTYSFQIFASDIWTIKYDSNGNKIWDRTIGGSNLDAGYGITTDSSGNIYVTGFTYIEAGAQARNVWTIKYDSDGNKIWDKIIGSVGGWTIDFGQGITTDSSGNIYVTGVTYVDGHGRDIWTIKYDSDGNKIWDKTIGGSDPDSGQGITTDSSGNIYVTGYTKSFGEGGYDIWTIKYDSNGNKIWDKTIGGSSDDIGRSITMDSSENIYVVGFTSSFGEGGDIWAIKYDSDGNQLWNKTIGGSDYDMGYGITADSSGNIYVTGDTNSFGEGGLDIWTIKIQ